VIAAGPAGWTVLTATTTPTPKPADPESVTPGLWGFLVVFILAIVVWLLMRNMTQRLRRLRFREQERQAREAADGWTGGPGREPDGEGRNRPDDDPPAPDAHP
jgi:flagellar biosynthesis/type III secretory pathway M-ring protein FliF/YscJ